MGRIEVTPATDREALEAFQTCAELEGILPALEPAHALAEVAKLAPTLRREQLIVHEHVRPRRQGHLHGGAASGRGAVTGRIERRFAALRARGPGGAGHLPLRRRSRPRDLVRAAARACRRPAPTSSRSACRSRDPMADGPAIQAASLRALACRHDAGQDAGPRSRACGAEDADTPLVLMGYYNPIHAYGAAALPRRCQGRRRRRPDHRRPAARGGRRAVPAGAGAGPLPSSAWPRPPPTTSGCRRCCGNTSGFLYYVSITGITGAAAPVAQQVGEAVDAHPAAHRPADRCRLRHPRAGPGGGDRPAWPMPPWSARHWSSSSPRAWTASAERARARRQPCTPRCAALAQSRAGGARAGELADQLSSRPKLRAWVGVERPDVPENLWHQCPSCERMIFHRDLEANQRVCPQCGFHMRVGPDYRFDALFDDGTWQRIELPKAPVDPLRFRDQKRYTDRLKEAQARTRTDDALEAAHGTIDGLPAVIAVMNFEFMAGSMGAALGDGLRHRGPPGRAAGGGLHRRHLVRRRADAGGRAVADADGAHHHRRRRGEGGGPALHRRADRSRPPAASPPRSPCWATSIWPSRARMIGFAGARVIEQTIRERLPDGFQRAEYLLEHGMIDAVVPRFEMRATLARILDLLMRRDRADEARAGRLRAEGEAPRARPRSSRRRLLVPAPPSELILDRLSRLHPKTHRPVARPHRAAAVERLGQPGAQAAAGRPHRRHQRQGIDAGHAGGDAARRRAARAPLHLAASGARSTSASCSTTSRSTRRSSPRRWSAASAPTATTPITFFEITTAAAFLAMRRDAGRHRAAGDRAWRPPRCHQRHRSGRGSRCCRRSRWTTRRISARRCRRSPARRPASSSPACPRHRRPAARRRPPPCCSPARRRDRRHLLLHGRDWQRASRRRGRSTRRASAGDPALAAPRRSQGMYQIENAGLAVVAALSLDDLRPGDDGDPAGPRSTPRWPARLQRLSAGRCVEALPPGPAVLLDGGHNPAAGEALARQPAASWRTPAAAARGRHAGDQGCRRLPPAPGAAGRAACSPCRSATAHLAPVSLEEVAACGGRARHRCERGGIAAGGSAADRRGCGRAVTILVCGSLYLAGDVLATNG